MNVRRTNFLLWTLTATFGAGALLSILLALVVPVDVTPEANTATRRTPTTTQSSPDAQLPLASFEPVWSLTLRHPLTDTPTTANASANANVTENVTPSTGGAPFTLVGTIGDTLAMIQAPSGAVEVHSVGEQAYGAKILAVRPSQVEIEFAGGKMTLTKPREPG
jgi:hypothetical protein